MLNRRNGDEYGLVIALSNEKNGQFRNECGLVGSPEQYESKKSIPSGDNCVVKTTRNIFRNKQY